MSAVARLDPGAAHPDHLPTFPVILASHRVHECHIEIR